MELTEEEKAVMRRVALNASRTRTENTAAAARSNGVKGGRPKGTGKPMSDEARAKMKAAQEARRERERAAVVGEGAAAE